MASVFTKIIQGDLPARFVWRDDQCVAFLPIAPIRPGHTLVVPVAEIDHWIDCPPELMDHLMSVANMIGRAQLQVFRPERIGLIIQGLEVPHTHLHVVPVSHPGDLDFANSDQDPSEEMLDRVHAQLTSAITAVR